VPCIALPSTLPDDHTDHAMASPHKLLAIGSLLAIGATAAIVPALGRRASTLEITSGGIELRSLGRQDWHPSPVANRAYVYGPAKKSSR
jgi:hypothetical protein